MITVNNRPAIARLAAKSLAANRTRNLIAVAAIALTSLLFTALFTIALSVVDTTQQQTFRQVGGDFHGSFKDLTSELVEQLQTDPLIQKSGRRLMLGFPEEAPFNKAQVEVSYMDESYATGGFCVLVAGRLPAEGTNEMACDTRVLGLLGITPELGAPVTLTYKLGGNTGKPVEVTSTFTLSGWWEYDPIKTASMVVVPRSYAESTLAAYTSADPRTDNTGKWTLEVYFKNSHNIEENLRTILANHGYQCDDSGKDNYIGIGVNWAYLSTQLNSGADPLTTAGLIAVLAVIVLTGYLIIYNVFQISVSNDIRFYGLLKTIGTTPRQLRRLVRRQALILSAVGIPIGLVLGYVVGVWLAPFTLLTISASSFTVSANPIIFLGAALFALVTVLISCAKPGRIAGKVSPVEAVRYTEGGSPKIKRTRRRRQNGGKPFGMALANLGRSPKKTVLAVVSLSLAAVLMQVTYSFAFGFDMDKYLRNRVVCDYVLSDAGYFQFRTNGELSEADIQAVDATGLAAASGRVSYADVYCYEPEENYRARMAGYTGGSDLDTYLQTAERDAAGNLINIGFVYGFSDFALDHVQVLAGDIAALRDPGQKAVAAVYNTDDYNQPVGVSNFAHLGETIPLRYVDSWELYDTRTGQAVTDPVSADEEYYNNRPLTYHEEEYTVVAEIVVPNPMGLRFFGNPTFAMNEQLIAADGDTQLLNYLIDTTPENETALGDFLEDYTTNVNLVLDYESKQGAVEQFEQLRGMFLLIGGALCAVVAVVGVLNFLNTILTSILTRRREFAMLQAVGMTGRQLKTMLMVEGVAYAALAAALSLVLSLGVGALMQHSVEQVIWFFTYRFTLLPLLVLTPLFGALGVLLPLVSYHFTNRQSLVERLRVTE